MFENLITLYLLDYRVPMPRPVDFPRDWQAGLLASEPVWGRSIVPKITIN